MANKNKKYKRSIEDAGRISDEEYYNIIEREVANLQRNQKKNGGDTVNKIDPSFNYVDRMVDTRSDTTRKGYHEGHASSAQSSNIHPFLDFYNFVDYHTNSTNPDSPRYKPGLVTGMAPTPGFKKDAFVEAGRKIGILKGARTASDKGQAAYRGRVIADREAIKLSGKKYISPYNNPSKGKMYNTGAITANDVFEETSKARIISSSKTNKVNTKANSTKTSRSVPYLNWANDYIKKNKLSTFMGSNGKMYVKTKEGKVKSVEALEKELRPY